MNKRAIFNVIQIKPNGYKASKIFDFFIAICIILNVLVTFLYTFDNLAYLFAIFKAVELITTIIFVIEYILHLWTADLEYNTDLGRGCFKFIKSGYGVVSLLAILSMPLPLQSNGFIVARFIHIFKSFRLFLVGKRSDVFDVIVTVLKRKRNALVSSTCIVFILMLASSMVIYSLEHEAQPENFKNAFSGLWWSMSTLLTVGYGDICPITPLGKAFGIIIAVLGVGVVAIPTGIISAGFVEFYTHIGDSAANIRLNPDLVKILDKRAKHNECSREDYLTHLILNEMDE